MAQMIYLTVRTSRYPKASKHHETLVFGG
jgi:hypothetical protein